MLGNNIANPLLFQILKMAKAMKKNNVRTSSPTPNHVVLYLIVRNLLFAEMLKPLQWTLQQTLRLDNNKQELDALTTQLS